RGGLVGAWLGYALGERGPVHLRLGAGALLGEIFDERAPGAFTVNDDATFSSPPLAERHAAKFFYGTPEAQVSWPGNRHVLLQAGVAVPVLVALRRPAWDATHTFRAGNNGLGQFAADKLIGPVLFAIAPGMGARYDF